MNFKVINGLSLSGLSATFVGNGIGRFAYIALMPILIREGWFSKSDASYLGAATLLGYLMGAPAANILVKRVQPSSLIKMAMLACSFSYLACCSEMLWMPWYILWRTLAGFGGALLMVLAPSMVLVQYPAQVRGRVSGVVFSGIGLGAAASGTLIPLLAYYSVTAAWLGMGVVCVILSVLTWERWNDGPASNAVTGGSDVHFSDLSSERRLALLLVLIAYTLNAVGYLPHTLFWVDYIVRELGMSVAIGGMFWAVFGIGAAVGPWVVGFLSDKFSFRSCLLVAFLLKAFGVALPLFSNGMVALFFSSMLVGMFTPGIVTMVSGYAMYLGGIKLHRKAWGAMTFSFAASQAVVGYVMAYLASGWNSYKPLFVVSSLALLVSVVCLLLIRAKTGVSE